MTSRGEFSSAVLTPPRHIRKWAGREVLGLLLAIRGQGQGS